MLVPTTFRTTIDGNRSGRRSPVKPTMLLRISFIAGPCRFGFDLRASGIHDDFKHTRLAKGLSDATAQASLHLSLLRARNICFMVELSFEFCARCAQTAFVHPSRGDLVIIGSSMS